MKPTWKSAFVCLEIEITLTVPLYWGKSKIHKTFELWEKEVLPTVPANPVRTLLFASSSLARPKSISFTRKSSLCNVIMTKWNMICALIDTLIFPVSCSTRVKQTNMVWQWSDGPSRLLAVAHHDVLWLQVEVDHLNINKVACEFLSRWHRSDYPRFWGFGVCNCLLCYLHAQAPLSSIISYLSCVIAIQSVIWLDFQEYAKSSGFYKFWITTNSIHQCLTPMSKSLLQHLDEGPRHFLALKAGFCTGCHSAFSFM